MDFQPDDGFPFHDDPHGGQARNAIRPLATYDWKSAMGIAADPRVSPSAQLSVASVGVVCTSTGPGRMVT